MRFKEIWNKYVVEDITKISDEIIEVFKEKFSDDIYEYYDIGELIVEFTGHHETANRYDKIEEFGKVVRDIHPKIYEDVGDYINEALIKYYCFVNDKENLKEQVSDFLNMNYSFDLLLQSIYQMLYNGHKDLVNMIVEKEYENVKINEELIPGAEYRLAVIKFYYELESSYNINKEEDVISWVDFLENIKRYEFEVAINDLHLNYLFIEIDSKETIEHVKELLAVFSDRERVIVKLERLFMQKMLSNNCSFGVSSHIWQKACEYFEEQESKTWIDYFWFNKSSYRDYLKSESGFFSNEKINEFLFLWGGEYIIEFLKSYDFYNSESDYTNQLQIIVELKEEFKTRRKNYLWEYNFVHKWESSSESNINEWKLEEEEFKKSYELVIKDEELNKLKFEELFGMNSFMPESSSEKTKFISVRTEKKIGRNEKVSVRYNEGSIKEDIKYKKVIKDLESGECELISVTKKSS